MAKKDGYRRGGRSSPGQRGRAGPTRARQEENDDLLQELEVFTMGHSESSPADEPERFVFACPGAEDGDVAMEEVRSGGAAVRQILQAETLEPEELARVRAVAVAAGETVGRRGEEPDGGVLVTVRSTSADR